MLTKAQKKEHFEQLRESLTDVGTLFLLAYRGLKVNDVNELRSKVRAADGTYRVVKNSVMRLAVEGTSMQLLSTQLEGPHALAFTRGDGAVLAKVIRDFMKAHPGLSYKQAYLEGQVVGAEVAEKIADLPSRQELVVRLLSLLQSPMRRLAVVLNGPVRNLASALQQIAEKKQEA